MVFLWVFGPETTNQPTRQLPRPAVSTATAMATSAVSMETQRAERDGERCITSFTAAAVSMETSTPPDPDWISFLIGCCQVRDHDHRKGGLYLGRGLIPEAPPLPVSHRGIWLVGTVWGRGQRREGSHYYQIFSLERTPGYSDPLITGFSGHFKKGVAHKLMNIKIERNCRLTVTFS